MSTIDLSVVIVNYNVKHFLEQCLISVIRASRSLSVEVIVVDNHSLDGSVEMVRKKFPSVSLIASPKNLGFSKGNNLALQDAKGEFVLLLNPDTIVEEDTFEKVVAFMREHDDAGGLGVRMLDGKGRFLPESKRGLPTPSVAFYKMFGLAKLFPKSKRFGKYHLTYLNEHETNEVDVLSGAFMLLRKSTLEQTGFLDETFFMYGEDIDLSYRIQLAGFKNYYYPGTSIIHYKGESTKKTSVNYVFVFYKAMVIFAQKHFTKNNAQLFGVLINLAIYFRAAITLLVNFFRQGFLGIFDFILAIIVLGFTVLGYTAATGISIPQDLVVRLLPVYAIIYVVSGFVVGAYDKPITIKSFGKGIGVGLGVILIFYALLPESSRFSRAVILVGSVATFLAGVVFRYILHQTSFFGFRLGSSVKKRFAIVGSSNEIKRVLKVLEQTSIQPKFIAKVCNESQEKLDDDFVGNVNQLREITRIFNIEEVVFCAEDVETSVILEQMSQLDGAKIDFKIAPPESLFVIGSNSINTSGELYSVLNINAISKPRNLRNKRLVDLVVSVFVIFSLPFIIWYQSKKGELISNILAVIFAQKTWVGYDSKGGNLYDLPVIKQGVLSTSAVVGSTNEIETAKMNVLYAKDYNPWNDISVVLRGWKQLGV